MAARVPPAAGIAAILAGLVFIIAGVAKPAIIWGTGKVEAGRSWIGESGLSIVFIAFGLVLAVVGAVALTRK